MLLPSHVTCFVMNRSEKPPPMTNCCCGDNSLMARSHQSSDRNRTNSIPLLAESCKYLKLPHGKNRASMR